MNELGAEPQQSPEIPDKLYFRIGEVSRLIGVEPYVLRYWESEFPSLAPKKSGTGHRLYRRKDVELLLQIKQLLYEKRFTIEGARRHLNLEDRSAKLARREKPPVKVRQADLFSSPDAALDQVRRELAAILETLK
jgi:DNA-binding transcriptional MerR regulator